MKVINVVSKESVSEFLNFPKLLFNKDENYIRPLDQDIENVFDSKKNKFFKLGECERFLFKNDEGKTVGKIAVFINKKYKQDQPTGGIGFFDCVDNQEAANFIFDFAKDWLQQKGMEAMDGPINFGERDKFWGLLIEGFSEPLYAMNYNPPYYKSLFENYGFQIYFNQLCFGRKIHDPVARNFLEMHQRISRNENITAKPLQLKSLEKFARDFTSVYNQAWASHGEGKQLTELQTLKMFKTLKPVINEHISWFVYENEKPIAMWMNIPDLNQWIKFFNGKFGILYKLLFLIIKKFSKNKKMVGLVFGIIPEWQRKGIDGFMIWEGTRHFQKTTDFEDYEMQWIGDFNPKMIRIAENLETKVTRKLATYRYLFDETKEFKRQEIL
ncbi:hypothetical protein Q73A0000_10610 [Kaistella flava (ex Peng et al. 2021)]|uniref:N-acetyltransferase domain-containing protein n=1 Tax=Kaistella flava (ex Peng et al. 2021) TaxID=2038776 RepID=A0A7M2YBN5_9FLAO|nr:hypothetical protein [Kaistella flava (ex Peng et al. 2021)]QOW10793.1 hypothetical protein Q73A0000_10610 [Kaistella flava (ex Peng et al. 2021)]